MQRDRTSERRPWAPSSTRLGLPVLLLLLGLTRAAGAQTDAERAAARSTAQAGDKAFKAQRYEEAAMYFARAEAIMHAPTLLLFLARSQAKLGQYVKARESYIKVLREQLAPDAPAAFVAAKRSAGEELPAVERKIATLTLVVPDVPLAKLRVTIDDEPVPSAIVGVPYPIDPGEHHVVVQAEGYASDEARVKLPPGQTRDITLALTRTSKPQASVIGPAKAVPRPSDKDARTDPGSAGDSGSNGMLIGGYVSLGVGAVGIGLGTLFAVHYVQAQNDANEAWSACLAKSQQGCQDEALAQETRDLDHEANVKGSQAWIAYGVGAAGLATGIALLALGGGNDSSDSSGTNAARVTPYVTANGFGVTGRF